jgi:hypothetical protein
MQTHDFVEIFVRPLMEAGIEVLVTGSVAAVFYGEPRLTHDIDLVLVLRPDQIDTLCRMFPLETYYCPPPEVIRIEIGRSHGAHFNLIHHDSGLKADCYLYAGDELHRWALEHRRTVALENLQIQLAPPEYVILRKLQYYREGGSQKHLRDIRGMLEQSGSELDRDFLDRELARRGLADLLPAVDWEQE